MNCKLCGVEIDVCIGTEYHSDAGDWEYCKACFCDLFTFTDADGNVVYGNAMNRDALGSCVITGETTFTERTGGDKV